MATAELVCEGSFETQITPSSHLTSDQSRVLPTCNPNHPQKIVTPPPSTKAVEHSPPSTAHDTASQTITDTQKDRVLLDDNALPQVCQQVEIVTEEANRTEACIPRIDAVWSISEEHSYEQKLHRPTDHQAAAQNATEPEPMPDDPSGSGGTCLEMQHAQTQPQSQVKGMQVLKTHMPQVLKIQSKPSKKYFIRDSPEPCSKTSKYLSLHGGGGGKTSAQPMAKSFKTLKVLQLPSHSSSHSGWNSCLIDHNLKPLQIQHNLEHKNKALAVLKLETLNLKYSRDGSQDSTRYSLHPDPSPSPASPFSGRRYKGKFLVKDDPDSSHRGEEVGTDAVYMDVDPDPSSNPDFAESMHQQEEEGEEKDWREEQSKMHSLSMDQYLPDFSDLPPFPNIPMDQPEDQYAETTHLTPSIQHNLFDYDWPHPYQYWNQQHTSSSSSSTFSPTPMVAVSALASPSALPTNPIPRTMVPSMAATSSPLPGHSSLVPAPISTCLDQFVDNDQSHSGQATGVGEGAEATVPGAGRPPPTIPFLGTNITTTPTLDAAATTKPSAVTQLVTATNTDTFPMMSNIKMEVQGSWSRPAESTRPLMSADHPPARESTLASSNADGADVNMKTAPVQTNGTISTALMTAFDLDSQPPLETVQTSLESQPLTYPYSDPAPYHHNDTTTSYTEPLYPDHSSQYGDGGGGGVGCSASTFLSPPPSVERQASQRSTPCPDNESGYITMDDQDLQSPAAAAPASLYWPTHHAHAHPHHSAPHHHHHYHHPSQNHHRHPSFPEDGGESGGGGAGGMSSYPATVTSEFGDGGSGGCSYPYTHQDSHYQTLNQTAASASANSGAPGSNDIIYYPFNDLMQLNPNLLGSDSDMSIQYVHPSSYYPAQQPYPAQQSDHGHPYSSDPSGGLNHPGHGGMRRRGGRGGRPRGSRGGGCPGSGVQIQSDQISSSLHRQLQQQTQMGVAVGGGGGGAGAGAGTAEAPKRQYRRRSNPMGHRRASSSSSSSLPRTPRGSCGGGGGGGSGVLLEGAGGGVVDGSGGGGERRGRHNEPLNQKAVDIMYEWYRQHEDNPYPSKEEKELMALEGAITTMQVKSWFANKRNRSNNTRPKVQKRAMEEKLIQIYQQLSKSAAAEAGGRGGLAGDGGMGGGGGSSSSNSFIIKELSQIIHAKMEPPHSPAVHDGPI